MFKGHLFCNGYLDLFISSLYFFSLWNSYILNAGGILNTSGCNVKKFLVRNMSLKLDGNNIKSPYSQLGEISIESLAEIRM